MAAERPSSLAPVLTIPDGTSLDSTLCVALLSALSATLPHESSRPVSELIRATAAHVAKSAAVHAWLPHCVSLLTKLDPEARVFVFVCEALY